MINVILFQNNPLFFFNLIMHKYNLYSKILFQLNKQKICVHTKILCLTAIHPYYVGFISKCNGIIGADASDLQCYLKTEKAIASGGASSYLRGDRGGGTT